MDERDLIRELSKRSGVAPEAVKAVLTELGALTGEKALPPGALPWVARAGALMPDPLAYRPDDADVERLIEGARRHPLGLEFLREGELCCVAATFQAHAFTVDEARRRLAAGLPPKE